MYDRSRLRKREAAAVDDKELIEVLKKLVARWRARYHTARNERDALIAEVARLRQGERDRQ